VEAELEAATGGHTRVVWMRDLGDGTATFGWGQRFALVGLDTRDGKGERGILPGPANFFRPLITPDGQQVVYTDQDENAVYVVNWDGSGKRKVNDGLAAALWQDPQTGEIWVYGKDEVGRQTNAVLRYPLLAPRRQEVIWSKTDSQLTTPGSLQVAADGRTMAMNMPWPISGVALSGDGPWTNNANGCWPGMAPDHSYLSWTFDGTHRNLIMRDPVKDREWKVPLASAPGVEGFQTYHPRWSNHPRVMTMTGPYDAGERKNKLTAGGSQVEVYVGRFSEEFDRIESWARVTDNKDADFFPDVWVEGGQSYASTLDRPEIPSPLESAVVDLGDAWPASSDGLVFLWKNNRVGNRAAPAGQLEKPAIPQTRGGARFGRNYEMELRGGSIHFEEAGEVISEACRLSGAFTLELLLTPSIADEFVTRTILTLSQREGAANFYLAQVRDKLVAGIRTSQTGEESEAVEVMTLEQGRANHVMVAYGSGVLTTYVDGVPILRSIDLRGDLSNWNPEARLLFGDAWKGRRQWSGYIEGVAVYNRKITDEEAAHKAELYRNVLAERRTPESWEVAAEVIEQAPAPELEVIHPYRRALVVNTYRPTAGNIPTDVDGTFKVVEWALLDGGEATSYKINRPGTSRSLRLQRLEDHPQLESERLIGGAEALDSELYVEVYPGS